MMPGLGNTLQPFPFRSIPVAMVTRCVSASTSWGMVLESMSLFFVVMKGEFDNILQWPFTHKVTFKLINQHDARDAVDVLQPDPLSSSFQKPKSDMNVASGCPRFVSMNELMQGGFIVDDTIFIKVKVDTATMCHP